MRRSRTAAGREGGGGAESECGKAGAAQGPAGESRGPESPGACIAGEGEGAEPTRREHGVARRAWRGRMVGIVDFEECHAKAALLVKRVSPNAGVYRVGKNCNGEKWKKFWSVRKNR